MILITGMLFFSFIFLSDYLDPVTSALGVSALMMAVWLGLIQNILSKGVKYGLFDPTKEMAYIPLDKTSKTKGKAAVDVIGGRLGKAAGGYISSSLLMLAGLWLTEPTVSSIAPVLAIFIISVIALWAYAVLKLSALYSEKTQTQKN